MLMIKGGMLIDPGNITGCYDIIIRNGKIAGIQKPGTYKESIKQDDVVIDAKGKIVTPGLIDMHVHLREPGHEYKETIASGCMAAAIGGFTAVCSMPNTNPVNDCAEITEYIIRKARQAGKARVYPVASISMGLKGKALSAFGELKHSGAVAVTDDGLPVSDSQLMRRAMEYAMGFDLPVISHAEDLQLSGNGVMNEGPSATRMGLSGIPNASEAVMVMRDIALCELTGARLHIAHVSTKESVDAIREAKKRGLPVTAETAPHYFSLTDEDIIEYNTNFKMNPPLRSVKDKEAVRQGLADGTIDVIATDHAPHSSLEKDVEFSLAANGIIGLETSLPLSLKLVKDKVITMETLIQKMTKNPARILGLEIGITEGLPADITVIDPEFSFTIDADRFYSKSRNTPFQGWQMTGKAMVTIVGGSIVFNESSDYTYA
ncbi:MAG: dihydroorotase [Desulfobacterium sp.]|nr:dihydroorotase [Desulfobacterium sp.]